MAVHTMRLLSVLLITVAAEPSPGRIPKVYNALITSNQNLEPSKAYPVYQPVLHDTFAYSVHPALYYGGDIIGNGILPPPALLPKAPKPSQAPPASNPESSEAPATEKPPNTPEPSEPASPEPEQPAQSEGSTAPPPAPNTESPIPLNEFGLPPQVLPLGRINPAYNGFTHLGPFTYSYPSIRLYDPFDPYSLGPYSFPLYRPLPNVLGPSISLLPAKLPEPVTAGPSTAAPSAQTPPPEPSDLNVLNYSSKDPAIPNVPPPPLPQSGLESDKSE